MKATFIALFFDGRHITMPADEVDHETIVNAALANSLNTRVTFPDSDVNRIIQENYDVEEPFRYTASQAWDMEVQTARRPTKYKCPLIRPGSVQLLGTTHTYPIESFARVTEQRQWLNPEEYTKVIEHILIDHERRKVFIVGLERLTLPDGEVLEAGQQQPVVHAVNSVEGTEERPIAKWEIVQATEGEDLELKDVWQHIATNDYLPIWSETYIREDLGRALVRK